MEIVRHREQVGGLWDELGEWQLRLLLEHGLLPEHYLLDIGCGCLRGGVKFISYLKRGRYFGVDKDPALLKAGLEIELNRAHLGKSPVLREMADFDFASLGRQFDYALAQSVFTHLPLNSIIRCILYVEKALASGGKFLATFFASEESRFVLTPMTHHCLDGELQTYLDQDPYHYHPSVFSWICHDISLDCEYLGECGHPRDQRLLVFTKRDK